MNLKILKHHLNSESVNQVFLTWFKTLSLFYIMFFLLIYHYIIPSHYHLLTIIIIFFFIRIFHVITFPLSVRLPLNFIHNHAIIVFIIHNHRIHLHHHPSKICLFHDHHHYFLHNDIFTLFVTCIYHINLPRHFLKKYITVFFINNFIPFFHDIFLSKPCNFLLILHCCNIYINTVILFLVNIYLYYISSSYSFRLWAMFFFRYKYLIYDHESSTPHPFVLYLSQHL